MSCTIFVVYCLCHVRFLSCIVCIVCNFCHLQLTTYMIYVMFTVVVQFKFEVLTHETFAFEYQKSPL